MFVTLCEDEKCEENWAIILRSAEMISFNFDMRSSVYARPKYINLLKIGLVVLEIWKAEFSYFTVPVYNTLVCSCVFCFLGC